MSLFLDDIENNRGKCALPHLTYDHIRLNSYSIMNVRLAAPVLSDRTAKALAKYGGDEAEETANFCSMMDKFLDIVEIRNLDEYKALRSTFDSRSTGEQNSKIQYGGRARIDQSKN